VIRIKHGPITTKPRAQATREQRMRINTLLTTIWRPAAAGSATSGALSPGRRRVATAPAAAGVTRLPRRGCERRSNEIGQPSVMIVAPRVVFAGPPTRPRGGRDSGGHLGSVAAGPRAGGRRSSQGRRRTRRVGPAPHGICGRSELPRRRMNRRALGRADSASRRWPVSLSAHIGPAPRSCSRSLVSSVSGR
jgi:hypothetical protein